MFATCDDNVISCWTTGAATNVGIVEASVYPCVTTSEIYEIKVDS